MLTNCVKVLNSRPLQITNNITINSIFHVHATFKTLAGREIPIHWSSEHNCFVLARIAVPEMTEYEAKQALALIKLSPQYKKKNYANLQLIKVEHHSFM